MILLAIILAAVGLFMIIRPHIVWAVAESWKSSDATEPSDLYLLSARFGGALCLLAGVGALIAKLVA